jgi:hypothetical protein
MVSPDDYAQFCFELYCDALRMKASARIVDADGRALIERWERLTERVWLQASPPLKRRCVRSVAKQ